MTETQIIQWVKTNLSPSIIPAIQGTIYTEDWLGAMACREVGGLINRYVTKGINPPEIWSLMRGDYTQRKGELKKQYHGFSPWQIDTGSFPTWVASGAWKDPFKSAVMAVSVLDGKRRYIQSKVKLSDDDMKRAIAAAYNTGEGNVVKSLNLPGRNVDRTTANGNYSADVWRMREIYKGL